MTCAGRSLVAVRRHLYHRIQLLSRSWQRSSTQPAHVSNAFLPPHRLGGRPSLTDGAPVHREPDDEDAVGPPRAVAWDGFAACANYSRSASGRPRRAGECTSDSLPN